MNITDYKSEAGDWTRAFRECARALGQSGGGILYVPAGAYITGPFELFSGTELRLEAGARINFVTDESHDMIIDSEFEGVSGKCHAPLIYAKNAENVRVTGAGAMDGGGEIWWKRVREKTLDMPRPNFMTFDSCRDVYIEGVTLINSPCWTIHPLRCAGVTIKNVKIRNPYDAPNTDGIDPDGCKNVIITGCEIDVGDDCLVIKSGTENTRDPMPSENIIVSNCLMLHGHGGVVIGSEMTGGVRDVMITGCVFRDTDRGIRIKTRRGRGGTVENVSIGDILMDGVMCPIVINMYYFCGADGHAERVWDKNPRSIDASTPVIRDISVSRVRAVNATACALFVYGLPESPVERLSITDTVITMRPGAPGLPAMMDFLEQSECAAPHIKNVKDYSCRDLKVIGTKVNGEII